MITNIAYLLFLLLESGRALIHAISNRKYLTPLLTLGLIYVDIIFLLSYILDPPKHEY